MQLRIFDNPLGYEALEELLYGQGYTLAFAAHGPQALQQATATSARGRARILTRRRWQRLRA